MSKKYLFLALVSLFIFCIAVGSYALLRGDSLPLLSIDEFGAVQVLVRDGEKEYDEQGEVAVHEKTLPTTALRFPDAEDVEILVEVADTNEARKQGLSGREELGHDEGMLFVFPQSDRYAFWMPDMNFAIDIIWINESREIVHIESNIAPESYPQKFKPRENAQYVLEISAGLAEVYGLSEGDRVQWEEI